MNDVDPRDLLELYTLGELGGEDVRVVEDWLAGRSDRADLLAAARETLSVLDAELAAPNGAKALAERIAQRLPEPESPAVPPRRTWRGALAVAAAVAVIAFVLHQGPERYPEPQAKGTYTIADGGELRRGAVLQIGNQGAALELGDYCRLDLDPDSVVRLAGEPRRERIFLEQGRVLCDVDGQAGQFAVETDLCTATVKGTRFIVQLDDQEGELPMLRRQALVRVLAGVVLVSGAWGEDVLRAAEEKRIVPAAEPQAAPAAKEDDAEALKAALKGFRGYLVGQVIERTDTGMVLLVRSVTLVEGCTAEKPGLVLGRETPVRYATEKGEDGKERPVQELVDAVRHIERMPAFAFGGMGGANAVVIMDADGGGDPGNAVKMMTRTMTMRINGQEIRIGGEDGDGQKPEPKGPLATARILADEQGNLVMDRVMPGGQAYATWDGMPKLRFTNRARKAEPEAPKPKPKDGADF
jgi:ferric-dicitrate binding protein FerR (iron transport regulator)